MQKPRFDINEIRAKHGEHGLAKMRHNVRELANVIDEIEQAMLADGRLVIDEKGVCRWSDKTTVPGKIYNLT